MALRCVQKVRSKGQGKIHRLTFAWKHPRRTWNGVSLNWYSLGRCVHRKTCRWQRTIFIQFCTNIPLWCATIHQRCTHILFGCSYNLQPPTNILPERATCIQGCTLRLFGLVGVFREPTNQIWVVLPPFKSVQPSFKIVSCVPGLCNHRQRSCCVCLGYATTSIGCAKAKTAHGHECALIAQLFLDCDLSFRWVGSGEASLGGSDSRRFCVHSRFCPKKSNGSVLYALRSSTTLVPGTTGVIVCFVLPDLGCRLGWCSALPSFLSPQEQSSRSVLGFPGFVYRRCGPTH